MKSYLSASRRLGARAALAIALLVLIGGGSLAAPAVSAADSVPAVAAEVPESPQQGEDGSSGSELPWLFAVFIITWAVFFAYVFVMSRRQREMQQEIDTLTRTVQERLQEEAGKE